MSNSTVNFQHEWEDAKGGVMRLPVPGGWIYRVYYTIGEEKNPAFVFVPEPEEVILE